MCGKFTRALLAHQIFWIFLKMAEFWTLVDQDILNTDLHSSKSRQKPTIQ
jgi:hypothetical protein